MKLTGPGGITVEQVNYTDKLGHSMRVLRLRRHGVWIGDFRTVDDLAKHVNLSDLREQNAAD